MKEYNIKKLFAFRCIEHIWYGGIIHYVFDQFGNYEINLTLYNLMINLSRGSCFSISLIKNDS